jgi:hypothetical protein
MANKMDFLSIAAAFVEIDKQGQRTISGIQESCSEPIILLLYVLHGSWTNREFRCTLRRTGYGKVALTLFLDSGIPEKVRRLVQLGAMDPKR